MAWQDIKNAIKGMLEENDYYVFNRNGIFQNPETYIVIVNGNENNIDGERNIGTNQYKQKRDFVLWVYNKTPMGITNLDLVKEVSKEGYEVILQDLKRIFGSVYNAVGDAGANRLQYLGMKYVEIPTEGIYSPLRMEVSFTVNYIESRRIGEIESSDSSVSSVSSQSSSSMEI